MRKYWQIFKIMLLSKLEYRFEMFSMFINELIGVVGVTILWNSIFQNSSTIGGLTREQTVIYYVILPLVGLFTSVSISGQLGDEIKNGQFSKYLLKPYRLRFGLFFSSLAEKIHTLTLILPIYLIGVFIFTHLYNYQGFTLENLIFGISFSLLGFLLHFLLDANISWLAFWLNDVWAFQHFKNFTFSIFGGINFPLNFIGGLLRKIFEFLPFKYFYYVPVGYLMGIRSAANIGQDLVGILVWAVCFAVGVFIFGLIIIMCLAVTLSLFSFIFVGASTLPRIVSQLIFEYKAYPHTIYKGIFKTVFFFIIPVVYVSSIPSQFLFKEITWWHLFFALFLAVFLWKLMFLTWDKMITYYSSASS